MLPFFKSESSKIREAAKNWLYIAKKVYDFRRDLMSESDCSKLTQLTEEVKAGLRSGDQSRLKASLEGMKGHLEQVGGNYYPRGSMAENVEFFFAALIIYLGFTSFFVKPFKIPTNSMWPTYYGMTGEVYKSGEDAPGAVSKLARFVGFGASHYKITAAEDGELLIPIISDATGRYFGDYFFEPEDARRYFVIPTPGKRFFVKIGDQLESFKVPADFSVRNEVYDKLFAANGENYLEELQARAKRGLVASRDTRRIQLSDKTFRNISVSWVRTGKMFSKGESVVNFDLMTGDQLFVDRMSYHFVEPSVGDGFVFKTELIPALGEDKFYIKRLVGTPGDEVQIIDSGMFVNGEPATGSEAFDRNANKEGLYQGYTTAPTGNPVRLDLNEIVTVPEDSFLALGDNSFNSLDGRAWGFVPAESVVGRPIMIYYPFTKRFGLAE